MTAMEMDIMTGTSSTKETTELTDKQIEDALHIKLKGMYNPPPKTAKYIANRLGGGRYHYLLGAGLSAKAMLELTQRSYGHELLTKIYHKVSSPAYSRGEAYPRLVRAFVPPPNCKTKLDDLIRGTTTPHLVTQRLSKAEQTVRGNFIRLWHSERGLHISQVWQWLGLRLGEQTLRRITKAQTEEHTTVGSAEGFLKLVTIEECRKMAQYIVSGEVFLLGWGTGTDRRRKRLTQLAMRVVGLPDVDTAYRAGIAYITAERALEENCLGNSDVRADHYREGKTHGAGGIASIGRLAVALDKGSLEGGVKEGGGRVALVAKDALNDMVGRNGNLFPDKASQVVVFRVGVGRTIYLNKRVRYMEFGPTLDHLSWTLPAIGAGSGVRVLRIIGASCLGLNGVWGWSVYRVNGGHGGTMVVPDAHWDAMIWLWERDIVLWPQMREAGGLPVGTMPAWNGSENGVCMGDLQERMYPAMDREMNVQPRRTRQLQEAVFTDEGNREGVMEIYIPRTSFRHRLSDLRTVVESWKGMEREIFVSLFVREVGEKIGMLCSYGTQGLMLWQMVYYAKESKSWWWFRDYDRCAAVQAQRRTGYPRIEDIEALLRDRDFFSIETFGYLILQSTPGPLRGLRPAEVWELAYKGLCGIEAGGSLIHLREATDAQKNGTQAGLRLTNRPSPLRIAETTPPMSDEQRKVREGERKAEAKLTVSPNDVHRPLCGVDTCGSRNCNPCRGYYNHQPGRREQACNRDTIDIPRPPLPPGTGEDYTAAALTMLAAARTTDTTVEQEM